MDLMAVEWAAGAAVVAAIALTLSIIVGGRRKRVEGRSTEDRS